MSGPHTPPHTHNLPWLLGSSLPRHPSLSLSLLFRLPGISHPLSPKPFPVLQGLSGTGRPSLRTISSRKPPPTLPSLLSAPCSCPVLSALGPKLSQEPLRPLATQVPRGFAEPAGAPPGSPVALSPCFLPTMQALVPLCRGVWGLTFLLPWGALQQAGAEAIAAPGWDAEQGPWRYSPEDGAAGKGTVGQVKNPGQGPGSESDSGTPGQVKGHDAETRVRSRGLRRCLGMWGWGWVGAAGRTGRGQTVPGVRVTFPKALGKRVAGDFQLGDLQKRK